MYVEIPVRRFKLATAMNSIRLVLIYNSSFVGPRNRGSFMNWEFEGHGESTTNNLDERPDSKRPLDSAYSCQLSLFQSTSKALQFRHHPLLYFWKNCYLSWFSSVHFESCQCHQHQNLNPDGSRKEEYLSDVLLWYQLWYVAIPSMGAESQSVSISPKIWPLSVVIPRMKRRRHIPLM